MKISLMQFFIHFKNIMNFIYYNTDNNIAYLYFMLYYCCKYVKLIFTTQKKIY